MKKIVMVSVVIIFGLCLMSTGARADPCYFQYEGNGGKVLEGHCHSSENERSALRAAAIACVEALIENLGDRKYEIGITIVVRKDQTSETKSQYVATTKIYFSSKNQKQIDRTYRCDFDSSSKSTSLSVQ